MLSFKRLVYEFLGIFALEETVKRFAPDFLLYLYTLIALLITWEAFLFSSKYNKISSCLIRFKESVGIIMTYIIVAFFGAGLASGYWWGIQKVFAKQETEPRESPEGQAVNKKTKIIEQLSQFIRNGDALVLKIDKTHISQFPSKFPQNRNAKAFPLEQEVAKWRLTVYNYLNAHVPAQAEYYHSLSKRDFPPKNYSYMSPQQKHRASLIEFMQVYTERIIKIIEYVDKSDN